MIEILLERGQVLRNGPNLGFNSDFSKSIVDILQNYGSYTYTHKTGKIDILRKDVKEVREV